MGYNVLIVDDSRSMRLLIREALVHAGVGKIFEASNGKKALEYIMTCYINLIISDYTMPGMTGIELLKLVKDNKKTENIPFVISSTEGNSEIVKEALDLGVLAYLLKPYAPSKISHLIDLLSAQPNFDKESNSLIVGRNKDDIDSLTNLLADRGNVGVVADTEEKARDFFDATLGLIGFRVVFIIWELNVLNPFKLIREIRHIETRLNSYQDVHTATPIVLLSHAQSEAVNNKLIDAGFTALLDKDNLPGEFDRKISGFF